MLPIARRALLIGLLGPAIQALGLLWLAAHLLLHHLHDPIDPRHLIFEGGFLTLCAGLLVSLICIPVAIEVARASEEDVSLHQFELEALESSPAPRFAHRRRAGAAE